MVHPMHIDWQSLEGAFISASSQIHAFLLPESGELVWLTDDMVSKERAEIAERLEAEACYEIDAPSSREVWNWMAEFAETVSQCAPARAARGGPERQRRISSFQGCSPR